VAAEQWGEEIVGYLIDFEPIGRRGEVDAGQSVLDAARQLGVDLVNLCGGGGTCGRCKVQVLEGNVSESTAGEQEHLPQDDLDRGYRLACQTYPSGDCKVHVPPESLTAPQRTQVEGLEVAVEPDPPVVAHPVELPAPGLSDLRADTDRLIETLARESGVSCRAIDVEALRELSPRLRAWEWNLMASVREGEIVAVGPPEGRQLGLAVDLGTTKIAGYLVDLEDGHTIASHGVMNPQIAYGEDLISRLSRAMESREEATRLQQLVLEGLNKMAAGLCRETGGGPGQIVEAVIVGNTAMHHLLLRLAVDQLAMAPYVPAISAFQDVKARDLGLRIAPGAYVHFLPNIAGYVGSDHVAMMLAMGLSDAQGVTLALDIGTNTEVCLVSKGEMCSVSCASGPAFEGAHIKHGMRAANGAIERLRLEGGKVEYQTIGGAAATGLCGSGILDAVAQLYLAGVLNRGGRMDLQTGVRVEEDQREFVLVEGEEGSERPGVTITQKDVRQVQLAKGAIRTGIQILLDSKGLSEGDIDEVIIAGAFGTYIDVGSAITIGMLPALPVDRFRQVGNAAGRGATLSLVSCAKRREAHALARKVGYIELASSPDFMNVFTQAMYLGPFRREEG
jgi:uncharacterized 2Fe-2S/4Fe-4S cluster protein (DUF4445 family)